MRRRWHPLTIGLVAAAAGLVAAVATGAVVQALDGGQPARPTPDVELSFGAEDDESGVDDLIGGDVAGTAAPAASFHLLDGGSMSLADLRGTPVVVNFFASWCAPCIEEMPDFEEVHQELGDQVAFVGIDVRDSIEAARALVERTGVTYVVGRDPSGGLFQDFAAVNMPSTFLISPDGVVVDSKAGALSADELRDRIAEHLLS